MIRFLYLSLSALFCTSLMIAQDNWQVSPEGTNVYKNELQAALKKESFDNAAEPLSAICGKTINKETRYLESSDIAYEMSELKKLITFRQNTAGFGLLLLITPEEAPALYNSLTVITNRLGLKKLPLVYVNHCAVKSSNAFAYSVFEGGPCLVILNAQLIDTADDQILEAIIAHELVHIVHHDSVTLQRLSEKLNLLSLGVSGVTLYHCYKQWKNPSLNQSALSRLKYAIQMIITNQLCALALLQVRQYNSRCNELRADRECAQALRSSTPMINALQLLDNAYPEEIARYNVALTDALEKNLELAQAQSTALTTLAMQCTAYLSYSVAKLSSKISGIVASYGLGTHPTTKTRIEQLKAI